MKVDGVGNIILKVQRISTPVQVRCSLRLQPASINQNDSGWRSRWKKKMATGEKYMN